MPIEELVPWWALFFCFSVLKAWSFVLSPVEGRQHDTHPRNGEHSMTESQKQQIVSFRRQGIGYLKIAQELDISQNTVKSYCRRNNLTKPTEITKIPKQIEKTEHFCLQCGVTVTQDSKRKLKKFCSDHCRIKWWNSHRELVQHKKAVEIECPNCHKHFAAVNGRKYCSHSCYIAHRFGCDSDE